MRISFNDEWDDGADHVYTQIPEVIAVATEEAVFLEEYSIIPNAMNYRSATNRAASRKKTCRGDEALRAAF